MSGYVAIRLTENIETKKKKPKQKSDEEVDIHPQIDR